MEPQTPDTSQNPVASDGAPASAGSPEPTAATEQPHRDGSEESVEIADADPGAAAAEDTAAIAAKVKELEDALRGRTEDLQRLQAEYVNYKRRVDRDRDVARNSGVEAVIIDLMSVLDTLRMAQEHEELTGGLKLMVEELDRIAAKYGLETYAAKGEPFDPTVHDALMQAPMPGVSEPTVLDVMQVGYRLKGRVLRAARVAVGMPTGDAPPATEASTPADTGTSETGASETGPAEAGATPQFAQPSTPTDRPGDASGQ